MNGTVTWRTVDDRQLLHTSFCEGGCLNGGCCVADDTCRCPVGWGGARCEVNMSTCGATAPVGSLVVGGLKARYYSDQVFDVVQMERVDPSINFYWSGSPAPGLIGNDWLVP